MGVYLDSPASIEPNVLSSLIHTKIRCVKLKNVIIDTQSVNIILAANVSHLNISTKRKSDISQRAIRLLLDHKELFDSLELQNGKSFRGIFPNPSRQYGHCLVYGKNVTLETEGLKSFSFHEKKVTSLRISDGSNITEDQFIQISKLPLRRFNISHCSLKQNKMYVSFVSGFSSVRSITLLNYRYVNLELVDVLCKKEQLKTLSIDLRHMTETDCLKAIQLILTSKIKKALILLSCKFIYANSIPDLKCNYPKNVIIKNYEFCELDNKLLLNLATSNIHLKYIHARTHQYNPIYNECNVKFNFCR